MPVCRAPDAPATAAAEWYQGCRHGDRLAAGQMVQPGAERHHFIRLGRPVRQAAAHAAGMDLVFEVDKAAAVGRQPWKARRRAAHGRHGGGRTRRTVARLATARLAGRCVGAVPRLAAALDPQLQRIAGGVGLQRTQLLWQEGVTAAPVGRCGDAPLALAEADATNAAICSAVTTRPVTSSASPCTTRRSARITPAARGAARCARRGPGRRATPPSPRRPGRAR